MPITSLSALTLDNHIDLGPTDNVSGDLPSGFTYFLRVENLSGSEKAHYDIRVDANPFKEGTLPVHGVEPSIELPPGKRVTTFNRSEKATIRVTLSSSSKK